MLVFVVSQVVLVGGVGAILGVLYGAAFPLTWFAIQPFYLPRSQSLIVEYVVHDARGNGIVGLIGGMNVGAIVGVVTGIIAGLYFFPLRQPRLFAWTVRLVA